MNMIRVSVLCLTLLFVGQAYGQSVAVKSEHYPLKAELFADGFDSPWAMAFLPDGDMLVTERAGRLYRIGDGNIVQIADAPEVWANGQGGLLDIELHPDYATAGQDWIYLTYSSPKQKGERGRGANTALMRARLLEDKLVDQQLLFKAQPNYPQAQHFGSRVVFDRAGFLYLTIGDRGGRDQVQRFDNFRGKVVRLHEDGRVPQDNPYTGDSLRHDEIWSTGHRNPQGLALHPQSGQIWAHEHGPKGGDELNVIRKGINYGWPLITYGVNYSGSSITDETSKPGLQQPVLHWTPSIAPSGLTFVSGNQYPKWEGNALVGSLKFRQIRRLEFDGATVKHQEVLFDGIGRVRAIEQGPDEFVYVATEKPGRIYRLVVSQ